MTPDVSKSPNWTYWDIPEDTIRLMVLLGHARRAEVYEFTDSGRKWLDDWCKEKIAEAEAKSGT